MKDGLSKLPPYPEAGESELPPMRSGWLFGKLIFFLLVTLLLGKVFAFIAPALAFLGLGLVMVPSLAVIAAAMMLLVFVVVICVLERSNEIDK